MEAEEIIQEVLQGHLTSPKWLAPRIVKIFIASTRADFIEERRQLLEVVGPELQNHYDQLGLEVELVDMHYGTESDPAYDSSMFADHLHEIRECHRVSRGCFFLCLVGNKYLPCPLPESLDADEFEALHRTSRDLGLRAELLETWYRRDEVTTVSKYLLKQPRESESWRDTGPSDSCEGSGEDWVQTFEDLQQVMQDAAKHLVESENHNGPSKFRKILQSAVEQQFTYALGLAPGTAHHIVAVIRDWEKLVEGDAKFQDIDPIQGRPSTVYRKHLKNFRDRLATSLPNENRAYLTVPWKPGGLDPDAEEHESYLNQFREMVTLKLQTLISRNLEEEPEIKGRNKTIQEVYQEALCHLALCQQHLNEAAPCWGNSEVLDRVKSLVVSAYESRQRHGPIIIHGTHGKGKSSLLASINKSCETWFDRKVIRVIRFAGASPRSAYGLELLRVICQHLCLVLNLDFLPKDCSFDPLYVNNWFQTLLRHVEETNNLLVIIIDDLQRLNPIDSDIVAALGWVPVSLPCNVHIICSTAEKPEALKFTPVQKERFKSPDTFIELPPLSMKNIEDLVLESTASQNYPLTIEQKQFVLKTGRDTPFPLYLKLLCYATIWQRDCPGLLPRTPTTLEQVIDVMLEVTEKQLGRQAVSRLSGFLTCTEFGLTEVELLELLMPTSGSLETIPLSKGLFNFSTFCTVRRRMAPLLREKIQSGKLLICWKHEIIADVARKRYLHSQDTLRSTHGEIGNLFFNEFQDTDNDEEEEKEEQSESSPKDNKETPFQSVATSDVTYSLRHVEESWIHLLKAGDTNSLKQLTVCNFDFLLAAVQTVSVSYLRCVLEHVRCYLLDRDLELVYYTIRKSSDVLTRDPLQLGAQIICWLRPVAVDGSGDLVATMITSAMAWCDGYSDPLLVPLNGWLQPPLPLQIKSLNIPGGVQLIQPTPTGQHVVITTPTGDPQLWHVMSNTLVHTFKGHSGPVLCLAVTKQSQYLLTGSEDISIIVWDLKTLNLKLRIYEHIAPILCVVPAINNSVIVSGGEDSRIIITSMLTGDVVMKIDHHRGPVTALAVNSTDDVLVSASTDSTVCLWSLENFNLLNTINLPSPVAMMDLSNDSVFLLAACEDNQLYLRSLATGSEIHCLQGHKSQVRSLCLAHDNCRAVIGGADGRVYIFDMHSGRLARTLQSHQPAVTGVKAIDKDDFLLSAGGNKIVFWSFRQDDTGKIHVPNTKSSQQSHTGAITCIDVSRDGTLAVTGSIDSLVNVWQLNSHELHSTLEGHTAPVTCVAFAPNGLFAVSGSEDQTARVWGLTLGLVVSSFKGHQATVTAVSVMLDSRRVLSSDRQGMLIVWHADNGMVLLSCVGPGKCLAVTNNMKYSVCGNGDNSLRIWTLSREDEKYTVSHSEEITCFVLSVDSQYVITGSKDMSLKVWQVVGGKLAQVLVGHSDQVTCVAVSIMNKSLVVSGSRDANLIVWDINTGNDIHVLTGHLSYVTCVKVAGDGSIAVSGSEDRCIIVWDIKTGLPRSCLQLHIPIINLDMSTDASRIAVHLFENKFLPIICLHNTPATYVKMPTYVQPSKEIEDLRPSAPKRPMRRLLKKEISLDTYTWQKKYGHLTSSIMVAAIDERLKRRFSVSTSMEEISKLPPKGSMGSQGIGPEQAALAQSQHFEHLEALWNRRSPPRRRHNQPLSKQNSRSSRRDSSDTGEELEEDSRGEVQTVMLRKPCCHHVKGVLADTRLTQSCHIS